jgi:uncharacterized protein (TIGR02118 family)
VIKIVMMVRRRSDLTHEQFRDHYEKVHAPLAQSLFTTLRGYVRNYAQNTLAGAETGFDVITELWFDDEQGWKEAVAAMATPGGQALQMDEESFMDRPATVAMRVQEFGSAIP